jgi:hypothetical protein
VEDYNPDAEEQASHLNESSSSSSTSKGGASSSQQRRSVGGRHYAKRHYQFATCWDRAKAAWSLILTEEGQPPMPITGGYHGAFLASKRSVIVRPSQRSAG